MTKNGTIVSIGMPVYQAENYLEETLDSLLAQTFENFELIISDNGSTDRTENICRSYAAKDDRIRYIRHDENLGASFNHNFVFEQSTGKYFKWAAHDDMCAPEFLEECVRVLEEDPSVVLCYPRTKAIDEQGNFIRDYPTKPLSDAPQARKRFFEFVCVPHPCVAIFGVSRSDMLRETTLLENYAASDRPLLGEIALRGRMYELPQFLFHYRNHGEQSWRANPTRRDQEQWFDPARAQRITLPFWRVMAEHLRSIQRVPLSASERLWCYAYMGYWVRKHWRRLYRNLIQLVA